MSVATVYFKEVHSRGHSFIEAWSGTSTCSWSLVLIFRGFEVLVSTSKPLNMSSQLQLQVDVPEIKYLNNGSEIQSRSYKPL